MAGTVTLQLRIQFVIHSGDLTQFTLIRIGRKRQLCTDSGAGIALAAQVPEHSKLLDLVIEDFDIRQGALSV